MKYEILNAPCRYFFDYDDEDDKVAAVSCYLIGQGWYALRRSYDGMIVFPLVGMCKEQIIKAWLKEQCIADLDRFIEHNATEIIKCLRSLCCEDKLVGFDIVKSRALYIAEKIEKGQNQ